MRRPLLALAALLLAACLVPKHPPAPPPSADSCPSHLTVPPPSAGPCPKQPPAPPPPAGLDCSDGDADWPMFGQNVCNTRVQKNGTPLTPASARKLAVKWSYEATPAPSFKAAGDAAGDISATPAVVAGSVYVPDWAGKLSRLDATSGKEIWSKSIDELAGFVPGPKKRGLISRTTPIVVGNAVIFGTQRAMPDVLTDKQLNAFMIAIDKDTAAVLWKTPLHDGNIAAIITGSPVLDGGRLYVGVSSHENLLEPPYTFRGSVAALDAATGKILWQTYTIEDSIYYGPGKTHRGYAGASVWSMPVVDRKRKSLYVTTGQNYSVPQGVTTLEDGNHMDSIMALDLDTGAIRWSRSVFVPGVVVRPDIWTTDHDGPDHDFGAGANLFTATIGCTVRDLVGAGQKSGWYTALDPDTGFIVWRTQVGPGGQLGGIHWGTATDGQRLYVGVNDHTGESWVLDGKGKHACETTKVGAWSALDPATGQILWQTPNPTPAGANGVSVNGPLTVAGGVLFGGSMDSSGHMYALDASTGEVLWDFTSGGSVYGGPAVVGGVVFWGAGYWMTVHGLAIGTHAPAKKKLYAFEPSP